MRERLVAAFAVLTLAGGIGALAIFALTDDSAPIVRSAPAAQVAPAFPRGEVPLPQGALPVPRPATPRPDYAEAELDSNPALAGVYSPPHPGQDGVPGTGDERTHLAANTILPICTAAELTRGQVAGCYSTNPPASGPHSASAAPWGILTTPAPKEVLVHNMEHGGVVVWYNTQDVAVLNQLLAIVTEARSQGRLVVLSKYEGMEAETIALTSWTRLDKFPARALGQGERVKLFISQHERRFNPEGF